MATLNELGRNSSSITYGPSSTGADTWPTFALVDQWLRNDTLQGTATVSSTTITGVGTIFTTQVRTGDIILIAGQSFTVLTVNSDTSITTAGAASPAITVASAMKMINTSYPTLTGTVSATVRNPTTGVISVTNGSTTITGVGTAFTTEATNSASGTAGSGTTNAGRQIVINGRLRTIVSFASDTSMVVNAPMDFTDSNIQYKVLPRGTIAVTASSTTVAGTATNLNTDFSAGDQIWIGDELRTITPSTTTAATLSAYTGGSIASLTQAVTGISVYRDETYLTGSGTSFTTQLRVGDDIMINGSEYTVSAILSDTSCRLTSLIVNTISSATVYKKRKLHGYVLEGTREGNGSGTAGNKFGIATTVATSTAIQAGSTTITVASATNFNQYGFIKIQAAGGPPVSLTGYANIVSATTTVTGTNTLFTTECHIGQEIMIAGQYVYVTAIASNTSMTISSSITTAATSPIYKTTPLYTYIAAVNGSVLTLGTPIKNNIYSVATPPGVWTPGSATALNGAADFIEYVYSTTNKYAETTQTLTNTSLDRKYFGFRFFPLAQTGVLSTAVGAYATPVYERWAAGYAQSQGVAINLADQSGGTVIVGTQATTTLTVTAVPAGQITVGMVISNSVGTVTAFGTGSGGAGTYTVTGSQTLASQTVTGAISGVTDQTPMTLTTGGFLYMFAQSRYFIIQGKSYSNVQQAWIGCVEFERAQPEDTGTGLGTTQGITYTTFGGNQEFAGLQALQSTPGISPWPCYAYFHSNRFPVGSGQTPTLPVAQTKIVHGGIFAIPRVRCSTGDLVSSNAHIYSAATITTGRWGHQYELGGSGSYQTTNAPSGGILTTNPADTIPQAHMGQIVPVFTNVYNSKRFMFSPVAILGPAYDPDIRGRIYGLKVIPSNLGTLMDTVSVTVNTDYFYDSTQSAVDHWVVTAAVQTYRFTLGGTTIQQSFRSLEDSTTQSSNAVTAFTNNFRWAIPA